MACDIQISFSIYNDKPFAVKSCEPYTQAIMKWIVFALMTVASWGLYGIFLNKGHVGMADHDNGLFKAFLFVGIAYFLTAVLAPLAILFANKATWTFPGGGMGWSLFAGIVGAIGAFCVLLAFKSGGTPGPVMTIVFAGAPIVNAVVAIAMNPPEHGWGSIDFRFYIGILLAALGGALVTFYKPPPAKHAPAPTAQVAPASPAKTN